METKGKIELIYNITSGGHVQYYRRAVQSHTFLRSSDHEIGALKHSACEIIKAIKWCCKKPGCVVENGDVVLACASIVGD